MKGSTLSQGSPGPLTRVEDDIRRDPSLELIDLTRLIFDTKPVALKVRVAKIQEIVSNCMRFALLSGF